MQKDNLQEIKKLHEYLRNVQAPSLSSIKKSNKTEDAMNALVTLHETALHASNQQENKNEKIDLDLKQSILIEKIAKDIYTNLLFTDTDNETVQTIKFALNKKFDAEFNLQYQALTNTVKVQKKTMQGNVDLQGEEKEEVLNILWKITLESVIDTMQNLSNGKENAMNVKKSSSSSGSFSAVGQAKTGRAYSSSAIGNVGASSSAQNVQALNNTGDTISVSSEGLLRTEAFHTAMSTSDIRQEKVNAIKDRIASGTYVIDTKRLAFNLLKDETILFK